MVAHFRVASKRIRAHSEDTGVAVVASTHAAPDAVAVEIAHLVKRLLDERKVGEPQPDCVPFPSLKSTAVQRMKDALEAPEIGLRVYAPRAGTFLDVPESEVIFGLFLRIFGKPVRGDFGGEEYDKYRNWLDKIEGVGKTLCQEDRQLDNYATRSENRDRSGRCRLYGIGCGGRTSRMVVGDGLRPAAV
jgi:DNA helicase-2/ATP-dependent DNA helicase PcrA